MKPTVQYRMSWDRPNDHLFDIEISFTTQRAKSELRLPVWRPGRYLVQNYAANVRQWGAFGSDRKPLKMYKTGKSNWIVEAPVGEKVRVTYRYFGGTLDAGSSFLDESEVYFNGSNLLMMVVDRRSEPASLRLQLPENWRVESQLPRNKSGLYVARDYDHLIDSPTIASPSLETYSFLESGCEVVLAFQNHEGVDVKQFVEPTRRIVAAHARLFGGIPTERYVFLIHVGDRWHGVEHEDSCSIIIKRAEMIGAREGDEGYDHTLAIISHEFFHLWNVKRILPARFVPYDYAVETPTRLLWVMEGITSYYGEKMLLRSGLWSKERYLKHLATEISALESTPAKSFLSLSQASFDAWLQEPWQMHDKGNSWISFYNKGEIVGALLDIEIRRRTNNEKSLDDVMRDLWTRYGQTGKGLEEDAIRKSLKLVTSQNFSEFFDRFVDGVDPLPYLDLLGAAGVAFQANTPTVLSLGMRLRNASGKLIVDAMRSDGAASAAGVLPGDEVIGWNESRVTSESNLQRLISASGDKPATLLTARNDVLISRRVKAERARNVEIELWVSPAVAPPVIGWLEADA